MARDSKQVEHIRSECIAAADVEDRRQTKFPSPDVLDFAREGEGVVVVEDSYPIHSEIVYTHVHERTCLPMLDHWTQNWMKLAPPQLSSTCQHVRRTAPRTAYTPDSQASRAASSPGGRRDYGSRQEREMVVGSAKKLELMRDMYHSS